MLCLAQLAALYLQAAELQDGVRRAYQALEAAASIRSVRLIDHLSMVRAAAVAHPVAADDEAAVKQLIADIDIGRLMITILRGGGVVEPEPALTARV